MMWWWPDKPPGKGRAAGKPGDEVEMTSGKTRKKTAKKSGQRPVMQAAVAMVRTAAKSALPPESAVSTGAAAQVDAGSVGEAGNSAVRPDDAAGDGRSVEP
jgi:hypothetical protein